MVPKELTTTLVHLKYLCIERISFIQRHGLPFLVLLIKSSPNLQKLKLEVSNIKSFLYSTPYLHFFKTARLLEFCDDAWLDEFMIRSFALKDYSDIWFEHLNEVEIINFYKRENELDFVKLILAKSPVLKKVEIYLENYVDKDEELEILEILSQSPHPLPLVETIIGKVEISYYVEFLV